LTGTPTLRIQPERQSTFGLTEQERAVLQKLLELREAPEALLVKATGLSSPELSGVLARLVTLNHVVKVMDEGQTVFRPAERPLGR
jgi:hypothetical protein